MFFDLREAHARALGHSHVAFCSVVRDITDPRRPSDYRPLHPFWFKRGYQHVAEAFASFSWKDVGAREESVKPLQLWARAL